MQGTIDEVIVKVTSKVDGDSATSIENLANSLSKLKASIKGGYGNLNKLAESLSKLQDSSKNLKSLEKTLSSLGGIADALKPLSEITSPKGLTKTIKDLEKLPTVISSITPDTLQNVARVSGQLAEALTPLANKFAEIAVGFSSLQALANKYGISVTKITESNNRASNSMSALKRIVNSVKTPFNKLQSVIEKFRKSTDKGFDKIISKSKQLYLSLLGTRSIFTATRKAISEYMQMDAELTKETTNLWRALGAQLAPALEEVLYLFKQAVRVVYSFVYAITGIDLIARANAKAMASWGSSAKNTLGSLQKFDDLNVAEFGSGSDDNQLIELDKIDLSPIQWLIDAVKKIKQTLEEAFDTGKWLNVGKAVGDLINDFSKFINDLDVLEKIENIASSLSDFINGLFTNISGADIGNTIETALLVIPRFINTSLRKIEWDIIGTKISDALGEINFETIITEWANKFILLTDGLQTAFLNIDTETLANSLSQIIKGLLNSINNLLTTIKWGEISTKLHDVIITMDWKGIFESVWDIIKNLLSGIGQTFAGLIFGKEFESEASSIWTGLAVVLGGVLVTTILPLIGSGLFSKLKTGLLSKLGLGSSTSTALTKDQGLGSMFDSLGDASKKLGTAVEIIAILGGLALVITTITDLLETFSKTGMSSKDALILIGGILGEIAIGFAALALATKLLDPADTLTILTLLGGLSVTLLSLATALTMINSLGLTNTKLLEQMAIIVGSLVILLGALTGFARLLGSNPMYMIAVVALAASLSLILFAVAATLPTILDATSKFINDIAPPIQMILETIGTLIQDIILALGVTLPPILNSIGKIFDTIFTGISKVVLSVGKVIVDIMNTAGNLIDTVLNSILNFINNLGPAINNFVDNCIIAVTKLINFLISGIEYMINTLVIGGINNMIKGINKLIPGDSLDINLINKVTIDRFVPKLETGTNEVPYEGLYHLHEGEAVVPKKYNPAVGGGYSGELDEKIDKLITIVENMETSTVVNLGNKTLYNEQKKYNNSQRNKYGTINI